MSESRLDQSLESIISSRKQSTRKGRGGRRSDAGGRPAATAAPVGGVKKSTKQNKQPKAAAAAPAAAPSGESKIMISNLVRACFQPNHQLSLTSRSRWMLSRINFRYVRPCQVFEPTLASRLRTNAFEPTTSNLLRGPRYGLLSHALHKRCTKSRVRQTPAVQPSIMRTPRGAIAKKVGNRCPRTTPTRG
jgi:hypothetical protein